MFNSGNPNAAVNPNGNASNNANIGTAPNINPGTGANFPNFPVTTPAGRDPSVTNNVTPGATPVKPVGPGSNPAFNTGINNPLLTGQTPTANSNLNLNAPNSAAPGVGLANQSVLDPNVAATIGTLGPASDNVQANGNSQVNPGMQNQTNANLNGNGAYNPHTRMQYYNSAWWYLQPNNQWLLYRNNTWVPYTAQPNGGPAAFVPTTSGPAPATSVENGVISGP